jgi:hypothetical protein
MKKISVYLIGSETWPILERIHQIRSGWTGVMIKNHYAQLPRHEKKNNSGKDHIQKFQRILIEDFDPNII